MRRSGSGPSQAMMAYPMLSSVAILAAQPAMSAGAVRGWNRGGRDFAEGRGGGSAAAGDEREMARALPCRPRRTRRRGRREERWAAPVFSPPDAWDIEAPPPVRGRMFAERCGRVDWQEAPPRAEERQPVGVLRPVPWARAPLRGRAICPTVRRRDQASAPRREGRRPRRPGGQARRRAPPPARGASPASCRRHGPPTSCRRGRETARRATRNRGLRPASGGARTKRGAGGRRSGAGVSLHVLAPFGTAWSR